MHSTLIISLLLTIMPLNEGWTFHFGHATDPANDFMQATEYFNYFTKAASIHNQGPYAVAFNDSDWLPVSLPHDWVPSLPYVAEGSHSHGYHAIGWRFPENSVGWYRHRLSVDSTMLSHPVTLVFDGIFRDSRVWVNGFYVGHEESGYTQQTYDISDYLVPGDDNIICVRVDATYEEGWFYEGAGIYRKAWLQIGEDKTLKTDNNAASAYSWSNTQGFMVNGVKVELKGVNLHQDHAGVGAAVPRGLMEYRLHRLQSMGVNAVRCSHNPNSSDMLDLCDSLGIYVIEETRLMGSNQLQRHVLENMILRDKHHRCIIAWSIGNEEWGIEWNERGEKIARTMTSWVHELDPSRPSIVATSSGPVIIRGTDLAGYNYIRQNDVDGEHERYPQRIALGSEETTGCGTRGIYFTQADKGHMAAINRTDTSSRNVIERGWQFYHARPWLAGLFYWTGFDYYGEPNPMQWPAVSSQFGILDNCGFPKDEAYYLQSWWTSEPVLHILPHWNLEGHEGETVDVWVYSNMDRVELFVNGRSQGRKVMPKDGHLSWSVKYKPGQIKAVGYKGKTKLQEVVYTAGPAASVQTAVSTFDDITVIDLTLLDAKSHFAATACNRVHVTLSGSGVVLGTGNGDPANHDVMPLVKNQHEAYVNAFNGHAQVIVRGCAGNISCTLEN